MRIGIISELFPPMFVGGGEISAYYLAQSLVEKGHEVVIITPNYGQKTVIERQGAFIIFRFEFPNVLKKQIISRFMSTPYAYFKFSNAIKIAVKRFDLEILHAQNSLSFIPVMLSGNIKKVATLRDYSSLCDCGICALERNPRMHSFLVYMKNKISWQPSRFLFCLYEYFNLMMKQFSLRRMDGLISISKYVKQSYEKINLDSRVIHNTVRLENMPMSKKEIRKKYKLPHGFIVLYVGKLSKGKGIKYFLEASKYVGNAHFVVIGDGPLRNDVIKFSKDNPKLHYLGKMPHDDVMELYKASDVVCFPSVWSEPLGRVAIESIALEIPCIGTNVGGIPEIIDDYVNGFLVEPRNSKQIAEKIKNLMRDTALRKKLSFNGKNKINEKFDGKKIADDTIKFYEEVLLE